ncbi:hypothetical protein [Methylobacterium sp. Leaf466]|uniref:hypothetical protein n=1 Tax=Methylobacterium sp. Leaf466 TaxID=1736386 RepID=UPI0006F3E4C8|nr:hypothetical protein [Methylobacterium sp. Leaf466]KQT82411.1 hypothetical protein ASG59_18640 [Methylobacterium sp. Leaf466]
MNLNTIEEILTGLVTVVQKVQEDEKTREAAKHAESAKWHSDNYVEALFQAAKTIPVSKVYGPDLVETIAQVIRDDLQAEATVSLASGTKINVEADPEAVQELAEAIASKLKAERIVR